MLKAEFGAAVMLLTRVPAGWLIGPIAIDPARAVWAFPLVGAAIGAAGGGVVALCMWAGMPPALAAVWALGVMALLSGGLHEDGWADIADGLGGGTRERKLEIMRDSRIGSYGAVALVLAAAVRIIAIGALAQRPFAALIAAGALSRGSMAIPLLLLGPAREAGLGSLMLGAGGRRWVCLGLGLAVAGVALAPGQALAGCGAALLAGLAMAGLARAQIGGFTGDVLGGCAVAAECAGLTAMVCVT